jgi:hypothetical protein
VTVVSNVQFARFTQTTDKAEAVACSEGFVCPENTTAITATNWLCPPGVCVLACACSEFGSMFVLTCTRSCCRICL